MGTTSITEYGNEQACSNCGDEWNTLTMESGVPLCEDCYSEWVASEGEAMWDGVWDTIDE